MVKDILQKLYGNLVVLSNLKGQRRIPYLPRERITELSTVDRKNYDLIVDDVINDLKGLLGDNTYIECKYCKEIRREGSAKFKPVISLCKPEEFML
ncbi:MAG: hypothetical protein KatS3mg078_0613 [Deltaproteobacteria bacterium]|nr:MAG: hypothetical protein KatS3mg078_0613 [Deltaproteobacteria bacterium]